MKLMSKLLCLSYLEHMTNEYVRSKVKSHVGPMEPLCAIVKQWKLIWFGHMAVHNSLCKLSSWEGTIDSVRMRGRQRKTELADNNIEWTSMTMPDILAKAVWSV